MGGRQLLIGVAFRQLMSRLASPGLGAVSATSVVGWLYDLFSAFQLRMRRVDIAASEIGELDTLESRLEPKRIAARSFGGCVGLVDAWLRKPR